MSKKKNTYYKLSEKVFEESGDKIELNNNVFNYGRNRPFMCVILLYLLAHANIIAPRHNGDCKIIPTKFCEKYNIPYYEFVRGMKMLNKHGYVRVINKDEETGEFEIYIEQDNPVKQYGKLRTRADKRKHYLKWD